VELHGQAVRVEAPIRVADPSAVIGDGLGKGILAPSAVQAAGSRERRVCLAEGDEQLHEADQVRIALDEIPLKPGRRVVLAVGVVVAALGAPELVSAEEQRRSAGHEEQRQQVALLPRTESQHGGIRGLPLGAAV